MVELDDRHESAVRHKAIREKHDICKTGDLNCPEKFRASGLSSEESAAVSILRATGDSPNKFREDRTSLADALKKFQGSHGLEANGELNAATRDKLIEAGGAKLKEDSHSAGLFNAVENLRVSAITSRGTTTADTARTERDTAAAKLNGDFVTLIRETRYTKGDGGQHTDQQVIDEFKTRYRTEFESRGISISGNLDLTNAKTQEAILEGAKQELAGRRAGLKEPGVDTARVAFLDERIAAGDTAVKAFKDHAAEVAGMDNRIAAGVSTAPAAAKALTSEERAAKAVLDHYPQYSRYATSLSDRGVKDEADIARLTIARFQYDVDHGAVTGDELTRRTRVGPANVRNPYGTALTALRTTFSEANGEIGVQTAEALGIMADARITLVREANRGQNGTLPEDAKSHIANLETPMETLRASFPGLTSHALTALQRS